MTPRGLRVDPDWSYYQAHFYPHNSLDNAPGCPPSLHKIFGLIRNCSRLNLDDFQTSDSVATEAGQDYDFRLVQRALDVVEDCSHPGADAQAEASWMINFSRNIFRALNNHWDERTGGNHPYHHW